jgi:hypothetical protein
VHAKIDWRCRIINTTRKFASLAGNAICSRRAIAAENLLPTES